MRFFFIALLIAIFLTTTYGVKPSQKKVLVTYDSETPDSEVERAIDALREAGGVVEHKFGSSTDVTSPSIWLTGFSFDQRVCSYGH